MRTLHVHNLSDQLPEKLLTWYDQHHRILPWRISPPDQARGVKPNPYHVWLSEIMLQQTVVAAVKDYFNKFIQLWPDLAALSRATLEDVLKAWAGLGYYSRAHNLKATADKIVSHYGGIFPSDYANLRALPGIGDYTAGAIMAIAYDKPYLAVDGNVERIVARLLALEATGKELKQLVVVHMQQLFLPQRAGDFAQSLMDLGSLICRPRNPSCCACPLGADCIALKRGQVTAFPVARPRVSKPLRTGIAFVVRSCQGRILLQRRSKGGLLAQMSEVPNHFGENISKQALEYAPLQGTWCYQGEITHIFTHFRLEMSVYFLNDVEEINQDDRWWVNETALSGQALPSVMKKVLKLACPQFL